MKQIKFPPTPKGIKRIAVILQGDIEEFGNIHVLIGVKKNILYAFEWDGVAKSFNRERQYVNIKEML